MTIRTGDTVKAVKRTAILEEGSTHLVEHVSLNGRITIYFDQYGYTDYTPDYFELVESDSDIAIKYLRILAEYEGHPENAKKIAAEALEKLGVGLL